MAKYYAYKGARYGSWELRWRYGALIHDEEERLLHENPKQIPEPQVERVFMRYMKKRVCEFPYRRLWMPHRYFELFAALCSLVLWCKRASCPPEKERQKALCA